MAGTVYASLVQHSYVMSLVCCAAQVRQWAAAWPSALPKAELCSCCSAACLHGCRAASHIHAFSAMQFFALLYYMASYFPGGTYSVQLVLNLMKGAVFQCLAGCQKVVCGS